MQIWETLPHVFGDSVVTLNIPCHRRSPWCIRTLSEGTGSVKGTRTVDVVARVLAGTHELIPMGFRTFLNICNIHVYFNITLYESVGQDQYLINQVGV